MADRSQHRQAAGAIKQGLTADSTLWVVAPINGRMLRERTRRLGIIEPCLPSPAKAPPSGPGWLHEIKHDGFRILARRDKAGVRLITRHGNDSTSRFPVVVAAVTALPARSFLIDGEAIVTNGDGLAVFDLIRHKRHGDAAVLCAATLFHCPVCAAKYEVVGFEAQPGPTPGGEVACICCDTHSKRARASTSSNTS